jgi:hypothetical protein
MIFFAPAMAYLACAEKAKLRGNPLIQQVFPARNRTVIPAL